MFVYAYVTCETMAYERQAWTRRAHNYNIFYAILDHA